MRILCAPMVGHWVNVFCWLGVDEARACDIGLSAILPWLAEVLVFTRTTLGEVGKSEAVLSRTALRMQPSLFSQLSRDC